MSTPELSYSRKVRFAILRLHPTPYAYVRTEAPEVLALALQALGDERRMRRRFSPLLDNVLNRVEQQQPVGLAPPPPIRGLELLQPITPLLQRARLIR